MDGDEELALRERIMDRLASVAEQNGGRVSRAELSALDVDGQVRRLVDTSKGIWNPRDLRATLSVISAPDGPYADRETEGGFLHYDYRKGSTAGDNTKLRRAFEEKLPIILLRKIAKGVFVPIFPVYVVADDLTARQFVLALDASLLLVADPNHPTDVERRYAERVTRQRLHQPEFRARVIRAYSTRCAVCELGHGVLLDAAHIVGDRKERGEPVVANGLSLCKIHHAAYDSNLMGIAPDLVVHINRRLLEEVDGPMLEHGLKGMHGRKISVPRRAADRPDPDRLALRHRDFVASV